MSDANWDAIYSERESRIDRLKEKVAAYQLGEGYQTLVKSLSKTSRNEVIWAAEVSVSAVCDIVREEQELNLSK